MKPLVALMLLLLHFQPRNTPQADIIDDLSVYFRTGNAREIGKAFDSSVELIIIDQEDVYSKAQSEQIVKDFFVKNPPQKIAILHRLNNVQVYRLGIYSLTTKNGKFRITVTLKKKSNNAFLITELRIEPDKE